MKTRDINLDIIAKVLIRSFWVGITILIISSFLSILGAERNYEFHKGLWSGLTRHEHDLIPLCSLAFFKSLVFALFLLPYLGIRMVLRQSCESNEESD